MSCILAARPALGALPGPRGLQRAEDGADRRVGVVERVEVEALDAGREQLLGLARGVGDAPGALGDGVAVAAPEPLVQRLRDVRVADLAEADEAGVAADGQDAGEDRDVDAGRRGVPSQSKKTELSKKSWVIRNSAPASTFGFR